MNRDEEFGPLSPRPAPVPARHDLRLADGETVDLYVHAAPGKAGGLPVIYAHGIQSHPAWFFGSAGALAAAGHRVYQPTRRGSGRARQDRGHARSAEQLLGDVATTVQYVLTDADADAAHLLGVSWGGKLLTCFAAQEDVPVASLTLVAPGIAPRVGVSPAWKLAIGLCLLCCPHRRFEIPLSDPSLFTDTPRMQQYIRDDAFSLRRGTARFLYASRQLDRMLRRTPDGAVTAPTTLLLADRDRIIDNDATRHAVERVTGGRATVETLPGSHTLEFEPDPAPFFRALIAAVARAETR